MKKVFLLFFLSLFLFIFPKQINANHVPECGSVCGGTCKPNEEFCSFGSEITFCMSSPNCTAPPPACNYNTSPDGCSGTSQWCWNGTCTGCSAGFLNCDRTQGCELSGSSCAAQPPTPTPTPTPTSAPTPSNASTPTNPPSPTAPTPQPTSPAGSTPAPGPACGKPGKACFSATCCSPSVCINAICSGPADPICATMTCDKNKEACPSPCGNSVCDKRLIGAGKCVDKATYCSDLIDGSKCKLVNGNDDCRKGEDEGCQNYYCWPDKLAKVLKSGDCKLGPPPAADIPVVPTKVPPLSPCLEWGGWNGKEYVPIPLDRLKEYQEDDGSFRPGDNINCIKLNTAIGEIDPSPKTFVAAIFSLVLGLAGGIALILIIISGYKFMTSGGNPESFQSAKDTLVSAIVGLLFIIFAFIILQVIGVDILHIPGFG